MTLAPFIENGWNIWIKTLSNGYKWNPKSLRRIDTGNSWNEYWDNEGIQNKMKSSGGIITYSP